MSVHFAPTPWARGAIGLDDAAGIEARATALGARVVAYGGPGAYGPWTVHVTSWPSGAIRESVYHAKGLLAPIIAGLLDNFRAQQDMVDEQLEDLGFTPDELVQIAAQSGIGVSRA